MTLKFNRVLMIVKVHVRAKFYQAKCSGFMSYQQCTRFRTTVDFDREYLWNGSSNRQAKTALSQYRIRFFPRSLKIIGWILVHWRNKWLSCGCRGACSCEISSSWVQRFTSYHVHKFFALYHNGKESENPVLWSWHLTYELEILCVACGCHATCCCKISSSCVQRLMSYRGHREGKTPTKIIQSVATARRVKH